MDRCPCCMKPQGTCDCQLQWLAAANGDRYEWCATHSRTVEAQIAPQEDDPLAEA